MSKNGRTLVNMGKHEYNIGKHGQTRKHAWANMGKQIKMGYMGKHE